ncbi:MAG: hypothetical protein ACRYHA_08025 [Janthinobacterium lividum]
MRETQQTSQNDPKRLQIRRIDAEIARSRQPGRAVMDIRHAPVSSRMAPAIRARRAAAANDSGITPTRKSTIVRSIIDA